METVPPQKVIYTIGHGNLAIEFFTQTLQLQQLELLVDVRSLPYSQYAPQFNRESLAQTLNESGIDYWFAGDWLGGRPNDPTCYWGGKIPTEKSAAYLRLVNYQAVTQRSWYQEGVLRLLELAQIKKCVILCSEEDPQKCHRQHLIAQTLLEKGLIVKHICKNGELKDAKTEIQQIGLL